ncbi:Na+/H+ antiporter subunit E [Mucisphaera calidilacus]|uniref:Na(+)/H(+) antiporter subunit E n=1 Tax=Mucisphaera calidilacus TaxID=2527982 RepID=A0A518BX64_9BACT|nr:Na+/H+ antiporter subunit E [Mucisphaera calidilacus]QDU71572.1 Na(+)/H(+) antiporter subunit E [Mucisphaera calidilacus]
MIGLFLLNLFLATLYMALVGSVTTLNLVFGLLIGFAITVLVSSLTGEGSYLSRITHLFSFTIYFFRILIFANLQVAYEVLTPTHHMEPRILRYDVRGLSPVQVTTLANAITLTPGTLTSDIDEEAGCLYIHSMYAGDRDKAIAEIDVLRDRIMKEVFNA